MMWFSQTFRKFLELMIQSKVSNGIVVTFEAY